ncbi:amino acid transporter [Dothidotthia symphoricarpi CBS 119687]|uniref:Amino acid transporter n=1 Tax=Dothidotthia symphoricarpi CBS 119687 TaxID=1392245 RepID=A0A6A6A2W4_9PLEO|nr:amino acid transporter [Dothidotthia symphoricarpi CBS 119687]KAF2126150.1 amino acid transporter [Dothidotthia symphoricarpi CBS 119687]
MASYGSEEISMGELNKGTSTTSQAAARRSTSYDDEDGGEAYHESIPGHTRQDRADMSRMGKVQELRRNYRPLSALAFTVILQGTWEVLMTATYQGLVDGGPAGLIWSFVWTWCGFSFVMLSLAEMASMAPTAGGQYHWVSEFAPPKYQKILSYFTGWQSTLSWQAGTASGPFLVGTLIQSSAVVMYPDYAPTNWQGTLMVIAVAILVWALNIWGSKAMPLIQNIMLVVHVFGFLATIIVFWVLSPRATAEVTFTKFTNGGGWSSTGLSLMVGQLSAIYACICSDAAAHMSEEIKDAGKTVPKAMIGSYLMNGGLGLIFLISFMFMITDVDAALNDVTGYPHMWVFGQAVSPGGVVALNTIPTILIFAGTLVYNLSTSRQTWAFARDQGLPFSEWIGRVNPKLQVPANSVTITTIITIALSFINIGSDVAFNAIISLNVVSLMITYVVSIGCVLYRRIRQPELLPSCQWSLGRWGIPVNIMGVLYSFHAFFWCFWPEGTPVAAETFNWAVVMFLGVAALSMVDYAFRGRKYYKGPVVLVEGYKGE